MGINIKKTQKMAGRGRPASKKVENKSQSKAAPADAEGKTKKAKKSVYRVVNKGAIFNVVQGVHPQIRVSNKALEVLQSMLSDLMEKLTVEAGNLSKCGGRTRIQAADVQGATKMYLGGDLASYAMQEGTRAVETYVAARKKE